MPEQQARPCRLTHKQADFFTCMIEAAFTAAPIFLSTLMSCLAGGGGNNSGNGDAYNPGDRHRCGQQSELPEK